MQNMYDSILHVSITFIINKETVLVNFSKLSFFYLYWNQVKIALLVK